MSEFPIRRLGILLRLHRRHRFIGRIFHQIRKLAKGRKVHVEISLDRPTAKVTTALNKALQGLPRTVTFHCDQPVLPILSAEHGEQWMANLRIQYERLLSHLPVQACILWDDDWLFSEEGLRETRGHLLDLKADRYEALSLFFWDDPNTYHAGMLSHMSPVMFRCYPGDDFDERFVVGAPLKVSRSSRRAALHWPLLNYGYLTQTDRDLAWQESKAAGRVDGHSMHFIESRPPLKPYLNETAPQLWQSHAPTP